MGWAQDGVPPSALAAHWDLSPLLLAVLGRDGALLHVNPTWSRVLGWSEGELRSMQVFDLLEPGRREGVRAFLIELQPGVPSQATEARWCRADGSTIWLRSRVVLGSQGVEIYLSASDATMVRAARRGAVRQAEAETLARVAATMAHDVKNLLSVMLANASLLQEQVHDKELAEELSDVIGAGERCSQLIRRMLGVARQPHARPEHVEIGSVVRSVCSQARGVLGGVEVVQCSPPGLWADVDQAALESTLLNLLINARDANARRIEVQVSGGDGVVLSVTDDGDGMPEEVRRHCVRPLFTTKGDKGTGLGLFGAARLADSVNGRLLVASAPGAGTTITLEFPCRSESSV